MGRLKQRLSGLKLPALKLPALKLPGWKLPGWGPAAGLAGWQRIAVVVGLAVLLLGAGSVAATAKVGATSGRVLAGVQISGVDVGGMTRDQAIAAVESAAVTPKLQRRVVVVGGGKRWLPDKVHVNLELLDERRFRNGTVYLRYRTTSS